MSLHHQKPTKNNSEAEVLNSFRQKVSPDISEDMIDLISDKEEQREADDCQNSGEKVCCVDI